MLFILLLLFLIVSVLSVLWLLIRGTSFGLNYWKEYLNGAQPSVFPRPRECSRCDGALPLFTRLRSFREFLLGGWTCPTCESEFDQLGNIRVARAWNANLRDLKARTKRKKMGIRTLAISRRSSGYSKNKATVMLRTTLIRAVS